MREEVVAAGSSGSPAFTFGAPPCAFSARTVATRTTASGFSPEQRHLMFQNFSKPMSDAKPDSVTT